MGQYLSPAKMGLPVKACIMLWIYNANLLSKKCGFGTLNYFATGLIFYTF